MDASAHFRDKRITLMGLGLLGRGVGDARYLAECGTELIVTDLKPRGELAESVTQLESFKNITFVLGQHRLEDFKNKDLILKAAGVPLDSIYIAEAKKNDIPVRMSADLFAELSGVACVGITGTRGKSTVAQMIYEILKASGKKVLLGGNMRGISTLALLKEVTSGHIAVLELDSWQLQGWGEARMSPHIAVFTTLYQDHLNYYGSTSLTTRKEHPEQYLADKANIFLYQKPEDTLILGAQCAPTIIDKYGENIEATTLVVDETKLPDTWVLRIPGIHNRYDAALALAAARAMDISDEISRRALESFSSISGRLELVREVNGVKIYNDTTATTPEATLAALSALESMSGRTTSQHDESKFSQPVRTSIILIMGGTDKKLDMNALLAKLTDMKRVILLAGTGTDRIKHELTGSMIYHTLSDAVIDAFAHAKAGDTILFSPAFTSFGMFKNEYDRGDQFVELVEKHYGK
mgnify:CR=1 FL=1